MAKLTIKQRSILGGSRTAEIWKEKRHTEKLQYERDPLPCRYCLLPLSFDNFLKKKIFCNSSCSASFNNSGVRRWGKDKPLCIHCQNPVKDNRNKYCTQQCQKDFENNIAIEHWKRTGDCGRKNGEISYVVRNYLVKEANYKCSKCNWTGVNERSGRVPLHVDHIDGDYLNNNPENLRVLCPNCHSLTPTYGALNYGNGRCIRRRLAKG